MTDAAPPPRPEWSKNREWRDDPDAAREASRWPDEAALQGTKDENQILILNNIGWIAVIALWFLSFVAVAAVAIWFWHLLTPYGWLTAPQLETIQNTIFSGTVGALVSAFVRMHFFR